MRFHMRYSFLRVNGSLTIAQLTISFFFSGWCKPLLRLTIRKGTYPIFIQPCKSRRSERKKCAGLQIVPKFFFTLSGGLCVFILLPQINIQEHNMYTGHTGTPIVHTLSCTFILPCSHFHRSYRHTSKLQLIHVQNTHALLSSRDIFCQNVKKRKITFFQLTKKHTIVIRLQLYNKDRNDRQILKV